MEAGFPLPVVLVPAHPAKGYAWSGGIWTRWCPRPKLPLPPACATVSRSPDVPAVPWPGPRGPPRRPRALVRTGRSAAAPHRVDGAMAVPDLQGMANGAGDEVLRVLQCLEGSEAAGQAGGDGG